MAWISELFYKESKSEKKRKYFIFFSVLGAKAGGGSDFFLQKIQILTF